MMSKHPASLLIFAFSLFAVLSRIEAERLLVVTACSDETDGYKRYMRSANVYGLKPKVLGMNESWTAEIADDLEFADCHHGRKITLLKLELEKYKNDKDVVVLFTDCYDIVITGNENEILSKFKAFKADIVFGAETLCYPDGSIAHLYPEADPPDGYRYLNAGAMIGYASVLYDILTSEKGSTDCDQLFFTYMFLDQEKYKNLVIKLDYTAYFFQNLHFEHVDTELELGEHDSRVINTRFRTRPVVIHGNGFPKIPINNYGNYIAKSWTKNEGCTTCKQGLLNLSDRKESAYPKVTAGIFVTKYTPFLEDMLEKFSELSYPKRRMYIFIYNSVRQHEKLITKWIQKQEKKGYIKIDYVPSFEVLSFRDAKTYVMKKCIEIDCDLFFNVDGEVQLDNPDTLKLLITYNRNVLAPIINQPGRLWSTFWGNITRHFFFAESFDYLNIATGERRGIWNVAYIYAVYVISRPVLENVLVHPGWFNFLKNHDDYDIALAGYFRLTNVFMYAVNLQDDYGHLAHLENKGDGKLLGDFWEMEINTFDWEAKYIHPKYFHAKDGPFEKLKFGLQDKMASKDASVFTIPIFSSSFCNELVESQEYINNMPESEFKNSQVLAKDVSDSEISKFNEYLELIIKSYIEPLVKKINSEEQCEVIKSPSNADPLKKELSNSLHCEDTTNTYSIHVVLRLPENFTEAQQTTSIHPPNIGWGIIYRGKAVDDFVENFYQFKAGESNVLTASIHL